MKTFKTLLKNCFVHISSSLARSIIKKYNPIVVMVTGSVGKTSTKDAVAAVLSEKFYVRKSEKSFNSDIGVPLTIIGAENPWSNPFAWLKVIGKGLKLVLVDVAYQKQKDTYPKLLVLEVGADKPGDLKNILKVVKPNAVVVTLLPSVPVHVEFYENPEAVREEEFSPARVLPPGAPLVIGADDPYAKEMAQSLQEEKGKVLLSYGVAEDADVRIEDIDFWIERNEREAAETQELLVGMKARITYKGEMYPLKVRGAIGRSQLFAPAASVAAGCALGVEITDVLEGLLRYAPPPGRGRIFNGKKGSLIIDDSYNSSPAAVEEILRSIENIPENFAKRKVIALGDMLELGVYSDAEHTRIGHLVYGIADVLFTVGPRAKGISDAAREDGMAPELIHHFEDSLQAAAHLEQFVREGDLLLIKGSQSIRMERMVRPLLAHFEDVAQLVRQDDEWQKR